MLLITYHGTLLAFDHTLGSLVQVVHTCDAGSTEPVEVRLSRLEQEDSRFSRFVHGIKETTFEVDSGPLEGYILQLRHDDNTVNLSKRGMYLCAEPPALGGKVTNDREAVSDWEKFILLSREDLNSLIWVTNQDWIVDSGRSLVRSCDVCLIPSFTLRVGSLSFDLRDNLPLTLSQPPLAITLLRDGWKIEQIFVYRPIIFFTAFRSPDVLGQLYLALQSLVEFGKFDGMIHIVTDQSKNVILQNVLDLDPAKLTVQNCFPNDWVGFVASKYSVLEHAEAFSFQPVIFSDPDVIFDADVMEMLLAVACSGSIAAPAEHFSVLGTAPSVGASMLQRDGWDPRLSIGFNAGTLGIPNLASHGSTLRLIRTILMNHARLYGRAHHAWVDQETANYVSFRIAHFDTHRLTPFVRYGWPGVEHNAEKRLGLVHFWPSHQPALKRKVMETYLLNLRKAVIDTSSR